MISTLFWDGNGPKSRWKASFDAVCLSFRRNVSASSPKCRLDIGETSVPFRWYDLALSALWCWQFGQIVLPISWLGNLILHKALIDNDLSKTSHNWRILRPSLCFLKCDDSQRTFNNKNIDIGTMQYQELVAGTGPVTTLLRHRKPSQILAVVTICAFFSRWLSCFQ